MFTRQSGLAGRASVSETFLCMLDATAPKVNVPVFRKVTCPAALYLYRRNKRCPKRWLSWMAQASALPANDSHQLPPFPIPGATACPLICHTCHLRVSVVPHPASTGCPRPRTVPCAVWTSRVRKPQLSRNSSPPCRPSAGEFGCTHRVSDWNAIRMGPSTNCATKISVAQFIDGPIRIAFP